VNQFAALKRVTIDPGNKYVGASLWDGSKFLYSTEMSPTDLIPWLKRLWGGTGPDEIICEEFVLYGDNRQKAQTGSKMDTPRLIGMIQMYCDERKIPLKMQGAAVRKVAEATPWCRTHIDLYGKPRSRHAWDAVLHGLYYLHLANRPPRKERQPKPKPKTFHKSSSQRGKASNRISSTKRGKESK